MQASSPTRASGQGWGTTSSPGPAMAYFCSMLTSAALCGTMIAGWTQWPSNWAAPPQPHRMPVLSMALRRTSSRPALSVGSAIRCYVDLAAGVMSWVLAGTTTPLVTAQAHLQGTFQHPPHLALPPASPNRSRSSAQLGCNARVRVPCFPSPGCRCCCLSASHDAIPVAGTRG